MFPVLWGLIWTTGPVTGIHVKVRTIPGHSNLLLYSPKENCSINGGRTGEWKVHLLHSWSMVKIKISMEVSHLSQAHSPHLDTTDFSLGLSNQFLKYLWPYKQVYAEHFFHRGIFLSYEALKAKMRKSPFPFWTYVQLRNFFNHPRPFPYWSRSHTLFEAICLGNMTQCPHDIYIVHPKYQ